MSGEPNIIVDASDPAPTIGDRAKAAANTHGVGYGGLVSIAIGLFGPALWDAYGHGPAAIATAVHAFGQILVLAGGGAAYAGRPAFVQSKSDDADKPLIG